MRLSRNLRSWSVLAAVLLASSTALLGCAVEGGGDEGDAPLNPQPLPPGPPSLNPQPLPPANGWPPPGGNPGSSSGSSGGGSYSGVNGGTGSSGSVGGADIPSAAPAPDAGAPAPCKTEVCRPTASLPLWSR